MRRILTSILLCLALSPAAFAQGGSGDVSSSGNVPIPSYDALNISMAGGIDCTGTADSTTGFQAAVTANQAIYIPRGCTVTVNSVNLSSRNYIFGDGDTSVLKHKASATGHMLSQSNAGAYTKLSSLTIDGNYANNGGDGSQSYGSFRLYAGGTSATAPSTVVISDVTFINGGAFDISSLYSVPAGPAYWFLTNVRHLGGADPLNTLTSAYAGAFSGGNAHYVIDGVLMDFQRSPTGVSASGRAGYIFSLYGAADTGYHNVTANNIQCYRMGNSNDSSHLGCFESYSGGELFSLTNAFSKDGNGRAFTWKTDSRRINVSNVLVSNLTANANNPSAASVDSAIGMNSGVITGAGTNATISNIQCYNVGGTCLVATFPNVLGNPTELFDNFVISNFLVDGCATVSTGRGISLNDARNVKVIGGSIRNCAAPIYAATSGVMTVGPVTITDVDIDSAGKPSFDSGVKSSSLWYARNRQATAFTSADLLRTVSANTVTAWTPSVVIDTSGGAQTLTTISNVPDGEEISVQASSASNTLTITSAGNIGVINTIVIKDTTSILRLKSIFGTLYPVGSYTQSLTPTRTATGALTIRPADGSAANGNARGTNAIDLQACVGNSAAQVASGTNSIAIGCQNTVTGNTATAIGYLNAASGVIGLAMGYRATDQGRAGYMAFSSSRFGVNGDQQAGQTMLAASTTSTSATRLVVDPASSATAGSTNIVNLVNNQSLSFEIVLDVRDTTTGDEVTYVGVTATLPRCKAKRGANAAATAMIGTCTMTPLSTPGGTLAGLTAPTVTADTTNGGLNVTFTNVTSNLTHVAASVRAVEVQ